LILIPIALVQAAVMKVTMKRLVEGKLVGVGVGVKVEQKKIRIILIDNFIY